MKTLVQLWGALFAGLAPTQAGTKMLVAIFAWMTPFPIIAADSYLAETINGAVDQLPREEPVIAIVEVALFRFSSRQTSSSTTEQSQRATPQPTTTAPNPLGSLNTSSHSTTVSPLSTSSSQSTKSSHNITLKASMGTIFPALGFAAIIAGYFLWRRRSTANAHAPRNDDPTPEPSFQPLNQPPPGQNPYEIQPINPLQGGESFVIAPDQDEHRLPPAVTRSPTPRSGPVSPYNRLFADLSQPQDNGPDQRAGNVAEEESLQRRYAAGS